MIDYTEDAANATAELVVEGKIKVFQPDEIDPARAWLREAD